MPTIFQMMTNRSAYDDITLLIEIFNAELLWQFSLVINGNRIVSFHYQVNMQVNF